MSVEIENLTLLERISAPNAEANIDLLYGPYNDLDAAKAELARFGREEVGVTVGVYVNGGVKEYWMQPVVGGRNDLVEKTLGLTPATMTTLGGIMTSTDDKPIDVDLLDTYIDPNTSRLYCVVPTFDGYVKGLVPAYNRGGDDEYKLTMFLNSKGLWNSAFSESNLAAPLYLDNRTKKVCLDFTSSFKVSSNKLCLQQATDIAFGGIKAGNWSDKPNGYSCYEVKFGNDSIDTEIYDPINRSYTTMSGEKLYVMIPDSSGEGIYYSAGEGIAISNLNLIYLKTASNSYIGGVKADNIPSIEEDLEIVPIYDPVDRASAGITDKYIEVKKGVSDIGNTDPKKLYITTLQILSVMDNRNKIGNTSDIDITDQDPGTNYSLVFDSEYSRTTNNKLVIKAGNYTTIQGTVDSELHLEDVGSYSDSEFPATTYVLVKTAGTAKFYFPPYDYEILQRDKGYLLKDTATVSKADFIDSTYSDTDKIGMTCNAGYYLLTIFGNILQIDKLADKRDIDL